MGGFGEGAGDLDLEVVVEVRSGEQDADLLEEGLSNSLHGVWFWVLIFFKHLGQSGCKFFGVDVFDVIFNNVHFLFLLPTEIHINMSNSL